MPEPAPLPVTVSPEPGSGVLPFAGEAFWGEDPGWVIAEGHVPLGEFMPWALAQIRSHYGEADAEDFASAWGGGEWGEHAHASPGTFAWLGYQPDEWWWWHLKPTPTSVPITGVSLDSSRLALSDHPPTEPPHQGPTEPPLEPWTGPPPPETLPGVRRVDVP